MSFDSLPDELLLEIVESCVDLFHSTDEFYCGEDPCHPPSHGLVWCKYWKLASLSAANRRMRRIASPALFSCILLKHTWLGEDDPDNVDFIIDPAIELLSKAVPQRARLAQHIRVIRASEKECVECLSENMTEMFCAIFPILPNLTSISGLPIRATHTFVSTINNRPDLQVVDVVGCPRVQPSNILPGERSNFLARVRFRHLDLHDGVATDVATEENIPNLSEWVAMGMRIKKLLYYFDIVNLPTVPLLRIPASSVDQLSVRTPNRDPDNSYLDAFKHGLAKWLERWPSSSTPDIQFCNIKDNGPVPPLCPEMHNFNIRNYILRASSGGSVSSESSLCIGGRAWRLVEADIVYRSWSIDEAAAPSDGTVAYHLPKVEILTMWNLSLTPEVIRSLPHLFGPLRHLQCICISGAGFSLPRSLLLEPRHGDQDFGRLDLEIRREIIESIFNALRNQAPSLRIVKVQWPYIY